jgi:hypothetical protein
VDYYLAAMADLEAENQHLRDSADLLETERDNALYRLDRPGGND